MPPRESANRPQERLRRGSQSRSPQQWKSPWRQRDDATVDGRDSETSLGRAPLQRCALREASEDTAGEKAHAHITLERQREIVPRTEPARPLVHLPLPLPRDVANPATSPSEERQTPKHHSRASARNSSTSTSRLAGHRQRRIVLASCGEFHPLPRIYCAERPGPNGPPSDRKVPANCAIVSVSTPPPVRFRTRIVRSVRRQWMSMLRRTRLAAVTSNDGGGEVALVDAVGDDDVRCVTPVRQDLSVLPGPEP